MTSAPKIHIGNRVISKDLPCYLVAELSGNHRQSFKEAKRLVRAAAEAGADAVKCQTYTADTLTIDCDKPYFQIKEGSPWEGRSLWELYREAYTPWEWQPELKKVAEQEGIDFFSTAFDDTSVDFLEEMGVQMHKVASFELVDLPLLRKVASTGKPVILSTGMGSLAEIDEAVRTLREAGASEIALMKCTSSYPAKPGDMNLRAIPHLEAAFGAPVGLSDHTLEPGVPVAAVTLGACIVEKHFTISRNQPGPDAQFSLEPGEFSAMSSAVSNAHKALGKPRCVVSPAEEASRVFRRSIFVVRDVQKGEIFTRGNIRVIRPGHGLVPRHLEAVLGMHARRDISRGTPFTWDLTRDKNPQKPKGTGE